MTTKNPPVRILVFLAIFVSLVGCADGVIRRGRQAAVNYSHLHDLEIGMSKNEVIDLMGRPSKTEVYDIQGRNMECWWFLTEYEKPYSAPNPKYTPLVFEGDTLKGWGAPYYELAIEQRKKIQ